MVVMASMASNKNNRFLAGNALVVLSVVLLASANAWAGDIKFKPSLTLNERYSDNVKLSSTNPTSSFLTEIRPGFLLSSRGARGDFLVDYGIQALIYSHDSNANEQFSQLSARLNSNWLDGRFAINSEARIGQQSTNSSGVLGTGNYNITNNRSEIRSLSLTPTWKSRFGDDANLDARLQFNFSDSNNGVVSSTTGNNLALSLSSGSSFNMVPWSLAYRTQSTSANSNAKGDRNSTVSGSLGYLLTSKTRFSLTLGSDRNNGTSTSFNNASGVYWNAGVNWAPTLRTGLAATAGKRYNGNSYGLNLTHRTRKSTWALRYSEEIIDVYAQVTALGAYDIYDCGGFPRIVSAGGSAPDRAECGGVNPQLVLPATLLPYPQLVNGFNLTKSWSGVTTYKTGKSIFSLSINSSRRELLASNNTDDTYSLGGTWSLRIGPRLSSSLLLNTSHAETSAAQSDDWSLAWIMSYKLSRQATGQVELRRVERTSGTTTGAYDENSVSARVNMSF